MKNGKKPKIAVQNFDCTLKRAPKRTATGSYRCTLKRTRPVSAPFDFRSGLPGTNPSFVKHFFQLIKSLFMILNLLEHLLGGIGLDLVILELNFENCPRTPTFPKLIFSREWSRIKVVH